MLLFILYVLAAFVVSRTDFKPRFLGDSSPGGAPGLEEEGAGAEFVGAGSVESVESWDSRVDRERPVSLRIEDRRFSLSLREWRVSVKGVRR